MNDTLKQTLEICFLIQTVKIIHLIMFKSGWPRNLVKNSLLKIGFFARLTKQKIFKIIKQYYAFT